MVHMVLCLNVFIIIFGQFTLESELIIYTILKMSFYKNVAT